MTGNYAAGYAFDRDADYQAELAKLAVAEMLAGLSCAAEGAGRARTEGW